MCRIFGLVDPGSRPERLQKLGARMVRLLDHGGPDGFAYQDFGGALVGSTRLAISDPRAGTQPFTADGVTVYYNGEIYNAPQLRRSLAAEGVTFRSRCDGEVIAPLLARHGIGAFSMLDGMFAIAAYVHRDRRLLLARDPSGVKPLYAFADPGRFGFASEIPALLAMRGTEARLDPDALDRYFRFKAVYGARTDSDALGDPTMIDGIVAVPPGQVIEIGSDARPTQHRLDEHQPDRPADPADSLGSSLRSVVAEMIPSDVPYCAVLSGGLDSTIVTTLAAQVAGPLEAFTVVPAKPSPYDERRFAQLAATAAGSTLRQIVVGGADIPRVLPAVVRHLGQPNSDPIITSTFVLFEAIRSAGYRVALTGDGSDELFGGYDRFTALAESRDTSAYRDALAGVGRQWRSSLYTDEFRGLLDQRRRDDEGPWSGPGPTNWPADPVIDFELRHRLPAYHLQRVDHLSAAHGVEARVPYCRDPIRLLGRTLLVTDKTTSDGIGKKALRTAARSRGWAPPEIIDRPKQPFTFRLSDHLRDDGGLGLAWARDVLTDPSSAHPWLDRSQVEKAVARFEERPSESHAHVVWALLVFALWAANAGVLS